MLELLDMLAFEVLLYRDFKNTELDQSLKTQDIIKRETNYYKRMLEESITKDTITQCLSEKGKHYALLRYIVAYHSNLIEEEKTQVIATLLEGGITKEPPYKDIAMSHLKLDEFTISSMLEGMEKTQDDFIETYFYLLKREDISNEQKNAIFALANAKNHTLEDILNVEEDENEKLKILVAYKEYENKEKSV